MERFYLYIVLSRPNTLISWLIQLIKNDEYTHAAISFDKELDCMYSFGRKHAYNPFIGIFKREEISKGLYKTHKNMPGVILEIEVSKQQYYIASNLINGFITNSRHYKYNYSGLIHGLFNKTACYENRFLCSEFVYHILLESGILDFKISRNLVRPQNFLNNVSNIVYQGNLKEVKYPLDFNRRMIYSESVSTL